MEDYQWRAITQCDSTYDGAFFYGVSTTGIFCRPSCKSRHPKPEHVKIFRSPLDAANHGFRPCKRCRPEELDWQGNDDEIVEQVKQIIDAQLGASITLSSISSVMSLNPFHIHRVFRRKTGTTIGEYVQNQRILEAKVLLTSTVLSITDVSTLTGFSSPSYFSSSFRKKTGLNPSQFRYQFSKST